MKFFRVTLAAAAVLLASFGFQPISRNEKLFAIVLINRDALVGASSLKSGIFFSENNGDAWEHTGWKNVRAFSIATYGDTMFLAAGNGVHRSTNGGAVWKIVTDWRITEAMRVAIDPDRKTIYTATAHGIWRSDDFGETWNEHNTGLKSTFTSTFLLDTATKKLFAGTEEALYSSTDRGDHWQRSEDSVVCGTGILNLQQSQSDPQIFYAATDDRGVLRSRDGGSHWTLVANGLLRTPYYSLAIDPRDENNIYVTGFHSGIFKTTDAGAHWKTIGGDSINGKTFHGLAVSSQTPGLICAGEFNGGLWRSFDGGETWKKIGLDGSQIWEIRFE